MAILPNMWAEKEQRMKHLTSKEAAEQLGISLRAVQLWAETGKIKAIKFGRDWRIAESEVERVNVGRRNRKTQSTGQKIDGV